MPYWQWYRKYQWVEVAVARNEKDPRKESYRPKVETIKPLGEPLSTKDGWAERRRVVLSGGARSMEQLQDQQREDRTSLGIVRPKVISDFVVEDGERSWKPEWVDLFKRRLLFGPNRKPLEKIPFRFFYCFQCDDPRCRGHKMMIEDWEVGSLYLRMRDKHRDERLAAEKVREQFFGRMCAPGIDTHFFVGTVLGHATWIILGVFWPKRLNSGR